MKSTLSIIAISALLGGTTAALAEVRIGATLAVTGPASFLGDPESKTLEMLVEQINAAGGIQGAAHPRDAPANNQDIHSGSGQRLEGCGSLVRT